MAEKSITNSNSLIDKVVSNIPGVTPELRKGDFAGHVTRNPGSTAASLLKFGTGAGMFTPAGLALGAIGSGIDSYNQSTQADEDLQAMGIHATGPSGEDRTTSAWGDFFGNDARDQKEDILLKLQRKYGLDKEGNFIKPPPTDFGSDAGDEINFEQIQQANALRNAPVTITALPDLPSVTPSNNAINTSNAPFYNSGIQGTNPKSIWQNPNAPSDPRMDDPLGSYSGVENMTSGEYINSPQQALDIETAQQYANADIGQGGGMDADGPGGDDWSGWAAEHGGQEWDY